MSPPDSLKALFAASLHLAQLIVPSRVMWHERHEGLTTWVYRLDLSTGAVQPVTTKLSSSAALGSRAPPYQPSISSVIAGVGRVTSWTPALRPLNCGSWLARESALASVE